MRRKGKCDGPCGRVVRVTVTTSRSDRAQRKAQHAGAGTPRVLSHETWFWFSGIYRNVLEHTRVKYSIQADRTPQGTPRSSPELGPMRTYAPASPLGLGGPARAPAAEAPSVWALPRPGWSPGASLALIGALFSRDFFFALLQPGLLSEDSQEFLQQKVGGNPGGGNVQCYSRDFITRYSS